MYASYHLCASFCFYYLDGLMELPTHVMSVLCSTTAASLILLICTNEYVAITAQTIHHVSVYSDVTHYANMPPDTPYMICTHIQAYIYRVNMKCSILQTSC